jgi:hypothetical protein
MKSEHEIIIIHASETHILELVKIWIKIKLQKVWNLKMNTSIGILHTLNSSKNTSNLNFKELIFE